MSRAGTVTVQVLPGWAVHDGTRHRVGGERVDADPADAARWLAAGWAEPVEPEPAPKRRRRTP